MHQYKLISRKGEGAFSEVFKAQSIKTGDYVAIKCMKTHFTSVEQVNQLREIQALKKASPYPHIIKLIEILYDEPTGRLALVFELMDMNMYELIKDRKTYLPQAKIKNYMYQLFKSIAHLHAKGIFHRDIKPENILIMGELVKLADLGSCRGAKGEHPYTEYISTRWYRSPECLMTDGYYDQKMDLWGAGCVMFEVLTLVPLFPGKNELDMIHRIHNILGTPPQEILDRFQSHASHLDFNFPAKVGTGIDKLLPHVSADCIDLLKQLLTYDPEKRITAEQVLQHDYFKEIVEADRHREFQMTMQSSRASFGIKNQQASPTELDKSITGHEKSPLQTHGVHKKVPKKPKENNSHHTKFPSLHVNVKLESFIKQSHLHDSSTEDEGDKGSTLPPLKQHMSTVQLETNFVVNGIGSNMKKNNTVKKLMNAYSKPMFGHQLLNKKSPRNDHSHLSDYLMVKKVT